MAQDACPNDERFGLAPLFLGVGMFFKGLV